MTTETNDIAPYPDRSEETNRNVAHQYLAHFADWGPGLGAIVERHIVPPLQRRRTAWLNLVTATLNQHSDVLEHLQSDVVKQDEFLTLFIRASQGAMATHETEKRLMFQAALHHALVAPSDFDTHVFFLSLLDQFQVLHVKLLAQFENPTSLVLSIYSTTDPTARTGRVADFVALAAGDAMKLPVRLAVRALSSTELIDLEETQRIEEPQMELIGAATPLGRRFLEFVTE